MDGWDTQDLEEIVVGGRRMRVGRRRLRRGPKTWVIVLTVLLLAAAGAGGYLYVRRTSGGDKIPNPAVVAGGHRAVIGAHNTITIGLEVTNTAPVPVTLIEARVIAPAGLTSTALSLLPTGKDNEGFALDGSLPPTVPIELGTNDSDRSAIIAARFTVNCAGLLAPGALSAEQIFVTVKIGEEQREEELTPPVVDNEAWLAGTARRVCLDPVATASAEPPLPPLPDVSGTATAGSSQTP